MSSTINAYAVDLERLRGAVGSGDEELIDGVASRQAGFLKSVDQVNDEAEITCIEALGHLVNGDECNDDYGYLYGYALEALCSQLGTELPNICGISGASEWIEIIDAALADQKVPLSLSTLVYGGSPIKIREPDDYPFIGCWSVPQIASALSVIERLDKIKLDREIQQTFDQIEKWLTAALERGSAIIGFLS